MLQFMGLQRIKHDLKTEKQQQQQMLSEREKLNNLYFFNIHPGMEFLSIFLIKKIHIMVCSID